MAKQLSVMKIPDPTVAARAWTFDYTRPTRTRWPDLAMTALHDRDGSITRKGTPVAPDTIRVNVRQRDGEQPYIGHISVHGRWARTRHQLPGWKQVLHDTPPGQALQIYAPDWVMQIAANALSRVARTAGED